MSDSGDEEAGTDLLPGLVVAHVGQGLAVELAAGEVAICHTRRKLGGVAVGDRVLYESLAEGEARVAKVLPRRSLLTRPAYGGKVRPVAANLDRVLVVMAFEPEPDWLLVDQYLAAAEHRGIDAALIVNKIDAAKGRADIQETIAHYGAIGYKSVFVSAKTGAGLDELRAMLKDCCSMLVGQSGVGKSSITNFLLPERQLKTRELSEKAGLGRHTTTTATLYHLPGGGDLIDSPGVAVFGLAEMSAAELAGSFREFQAVFGQCRFNDCSHGADQGCAIREAVEDGRIGKDRYRRFLKLVEKMFLV